MRFLRGLSRILIGVTFIVSGFLKALDPVGTSLKIKEYLSVMHLNPFDFTALPAAVILCCIEFVTGVAILKGLKVKLFSAVSLVLALFFTILSLCTAIFLPIEDCGCFGDALHLTGLQTFVKNILLLGATAIVYMQRNSFSPIATRFWQNIYTCAYTLFIAVTALYSLFFLPIADFGQFKPGTDLTEKLLENQLREYKTILVYSKEGKKQEFTLDNLPDSTWSFTDSKSILISEENDGSIDFSIRDSRGMVITDSILSLNTPVVIVSVLDQLSNSKITEIELLASSVAKAGGKLFILSALGEEITNSSIPVYSSDYKTVVSLNRSNGGAIYICEGVVVKKWSRYNYPSDIEHIFEQSPDIIIANSIIKEQLFIEFSLVLISVMAIAIRYISKRLYNRPHLSQ